MDIVTISDEVLEELCRFMYISKDHLKIFVSTNWSKDREADKLWDLLSAPSNQTLKSDDITKQQFKKFIKRYSHLNDDQVNELTD